MERFIDIGTATTHYADYSVELSEAARLRHMFIVGKTGQGKSILLQRMAVEDLKAGNGFAFFDPHGDTARELINYVPPHRMRDVVYLRPADYSRSVGYNVLDNVREREKDRVTQEVVSTFRYRWADSWGARMENIFKHTVRAVLDIPTRHGGPTLLSVTLMLQHEAYRKWVLKRCKTRAVFDYFRYEFDKFTPQQKVDWVQPILNKVDQFTLSDVVRDVVGQAQSTIDLEYMMDNRKVLILDLDKGATGEDDADTIGSLLVTGFQLAAMRRSKRPPEERTPFYLYLDEFHSFTTGSFASIMSESRKYGLGMVLAGQYLEQIKQKQVRAAVFGNCGNICSFQVGNDDAVQMAPTLETNAAALEDLSIGQARIKCLDDGHPRSMFVTTHMLDPNDHTGSGLKVEEYSRRFATPTEDIHSRHIQWLNNVTRIPTEEQAAEMKRERLRLKREREQLRQEKLRQDKEKLKLDKQKLQQDNKDLQQKIKDFTTGP